MAADVPEGALSMDAVVEWLPDRRLGIEHVPQLVDQDVDRITVHIGMLTQDDAGEFISAVYVGDADHEVVHAAGFVLEEERWVGIESWVGDEYDADVVEETVVEWIKSRYPDSEFSRG